MNFGHQSQGGGRVKEKTGGRNDQIRREEIINMLRPQKQGGDCPAAFCKSCSFPPSLKGAAFRSGQRDLSQQEEED